MTGVTGRALAITIYTAQQLGELAKAFSAIQANLTYRASAKQKTVIENVQIPIAPTTNNLQRKSKKSVTLSSTAALQQQFRPIAHREIK